MSDLITFLKPYLDVFSGLCIVLIIAIVVLFGVIFISYFTRSTNDNQESINKEEELRDLYCRICSVKSDLVHVVRDELERFTRNK